MDKIWTVARKKVDARQRDGDIRDSIIDNKILEFEKAGYPFPEQGFSNLFGELLEAGADSRCSRPGSG